MESPIPFKFKRFVYLALSLGLFVAVYVLLLVIFKDRIFLDNLKTSYLKIKKHLTRERIRPK